MELTRSKQTGNLRLHGSSFTKDSQLGCHQPVALQPQDNQSWSPKLMPSRTQEKELGRCHPTQVRLERTLTEGQAHAMSSGTRAARPADQGGTLGSSCSTGCPAGSFLFSPLQTEGYCSYLALSSPLLVGCCEEHNLFGHKSPDSKKKKKKNLLAGVREVTMYHPAIPAILRWISGLPP